MYALTLTLSRAKAGRFSLPHRSSRHGSTTGLPDQANISGRVRVAVQHQPTGGTHMGTHREAFGHPRPTAATVLAGVLRRDRHHPTPSACCFGGEDAAELRPAGIADAFAEMPVPHHGSDPQGFEIEPVVLAHEGEGRLVV